MRPQTRHYISRDLIFDHFKPNLLNKEEFIKIMGKETDFEKFSKKWFIPGVLFAASPYQLKDAVAIFNIVFSPERSLGTLSAILYHTNHIE